MIIIRILSLLAGLLLVSAGMGLVPAVHICKGNKRAVLLWALVCGLICMWGLFQAVSIPFLLMKRPFSHVVYLYGICIVLWITGSLIYIFVDRKKRIFAIPERGSRTTGEKVMWGIFIALLLFQLFQAVFLSYADGDDAYYIGVAATTESSDTMYRVIPYTGETTELDTRHGLAPFPVWIAFLARVSGCPVAVTAHVVLPLFLIPMTYLIYAFLGSRILRDKKRLPLFLILLEVLVLWSNYSFYTAETFLLTRSRQGKAAVANLMLPFLILLLFLIGERLQEKKRVGAALWFLLVTGVTAACLCTTLASFFSCLLIGISGICMAFSYKNYKILVPLCLCCIPALLYFGLFVLF